MHSIIKARAPNRKTHSEDAKMRSMGSDAVETELSTPLFQMWSLCHPCEDPGANSPCRIVGCLSSTYQKICKWRFRVLVLKFSCVYVTVSILKSLKETKTERI